MQINLLEWRLDAMERVQIEMDKRLQDLIIVNQNQTTVIADMSLRLSALERGALLGMNSALLSRPTANYPRGYGP